MSPAEIAKWRAASPLLPDGGCEAVRKLLDEIEARDKQLEDMTTQAVFWKQAAEHAVDGWTKQEDVCIALREKLLEVCDLHIRTASGALFDVERAEKLKAEVLADNGDDT